MHALNERQWANEHYYMRVMRLCKLQRDNDAENTFTALRAMVKWMMQTKYGKASEPRTTHEMNAHVRYCAMWCALGAVCVRIYT